MLVNLQSSETYFTQLHMLISQTQVTDGHGRTLSLDAGVQAAVRLLLETKTAGRKAMLAGNGGSAAIISHIQNDLCKFVGMRAMVFNEPSLLTALANDHGYHTVFERPFDLWADPNDVLLAVSSSGQSESILNPVQAARQHDCRVITFSGFRPNNPLRALGDVNFYVASSEYGHVEVAHASLAHFITDSLGLYLMTK